MRTIMLGALASATLLITSANAADMRRPVYKAPPAVAPAFSWTGCYIGGHVGYGWGNKHWTDTVLDLGIADYDVDGALAGGQIGCDVQTGPWVFGIEGQGSWTGIDGSGPFLPPGGTTSFHTDIDSLWSVTGRVGYAWDRSLFYAKGGAAAVNEKFHSTTAAGVTFESFSDTRWGWTVGAGWEFSFAPNWSWKIEYNYADFGSESYNNTDLLTGVALNTVEIDQHIHTVKFGINYRFGDYGKGPVAARY